MSEILRKLTSRKFWMAIAGIVTGIAMAFGVDEGAISTIAGAVTAVASAVAYIVSEGNVDAARVKQAVECVQDAVETISETEVNGYELKDLSGK